MHRMETRDLVSFLLAQCHRHMQREGDKGWQWHFTEVNCSVTRHEARTNESQAGVAVVHCVLSHGPAAACQLQHNIYTFSPSIIVIPADGM